MEKLRVLNSMKKICNDQSGMALVFSIMVLVLISIWGAATLNLSTNEYIINNNSKKAIQAYYLAEAGLEEAIANLQIDPENFVGFSGNLETGSYSVSKNGTVPGNVTLSSVGTVDGSFKKTLTAQLAITALYSGGSQSPTITLFGDNGNGQIKNCTFVVNGDVLLNDDISIHGTTTTISNNLLYNGELGIGNNNTIVIGGEEITNFPPPEYPENYLDNISPPSGEPYLIGSKDIYSLPNLNGKAYYQLTKNNANLYNISNDNPDIFVIYSDNTIDINGNLENVIIVADNINIHTSVTLTNVILYGQTDIDIDGEAVSINGGIITDGQLKINNSTLTHYGSVYANNIFINQAAVTLTYDEEILKDISWPLLSQGYKITLEKWD